MKLIDQIQEPTIQANIAQDCVQFMEEFIANKKGLGGMTFKAVYKALNGVKPNYIEGAIERLLPSVATALDPLWNEGINQGDPVAHLENNADTTADLILGVTDVRIEQTSNKIIKTAYKQVRKSVKPEIVASVPSLAKILAQHIQT